jgi:aminotransferase
MSKLHTSAISPGLVQSEIRAMSLLADEVGGINMAQGICDTPVPAAVMAGAEAAIEAGHNIYTRQDGIARLRRAISADWRRRNGIEPNAETEVVISSGATGAFYTAALALLDPGDEAILFEPMYGYHAATLRGLGVTPVIVSLEWGTWALDLDAVRAAITPRTRLIVINTPSNPCGKIFTRTELEGIAQLAIENDLFVFSDEIYEHFIYPGHTHISIATLPDMWQRTVTLSGFSKTFSVTGWRVGYLIASAKWTPTIGYFNDSVYVCAPAPFQHGCAAGLEQLPPSFYTNMAADHLRKRDMTVAALTAAGLTPHVPDGAYYILASATPLHGDTAAARSRDLLARTGVAAVAGTAFFRPGVGANLLRFCFAKQDTDLAEACNRLRTLA